MRSETLEIRLKAFRLPSFLSNYLEAAQKADKAGWTHVPYLEALSEIEAQDRQNRRVGRMLKESKLPAGKTLAMPEQRPEIAVVSQNRGGLLHA